MSQRGPRRRRRDQSELDQGLTAGVGSNKDTDVTSQVDVQGILSQAYQLAESAQQKMLRKKTALDAPASRPLLQPRQKSSSHKLLSAPLQSVSKDLADSDERSFFLAEKRKKFEISVRDHPEKMRYWLEYAQFEETVTKEIDRCRSIYDRAVVHHANNPEIVFHRVQLEERLGNVESAIDLYIRIGIAKFPKDDRFYYRVAYLNERIGKLQDNPFDRWTSRVLPSDLLMAENINEDDKSYLRQIKCPLHESVLHFAFEHSIEWTIRTHKSALRRELSANTDDPRKQSSLCFSSMNNHTASPTIDAIRSMCQKYVSTLNDSTSWSFYAKIENDVLRNFARAELVYRVGIRSIPIDFNAVDSSENRSSVMKLRLFSDFLRFVARQGRYDRNRHAIIGIWNAHFSIACYPSKSAEREESDSAAEIMRVLADKISFRTNEISMVKLKETRPPSAMDHHEAGLYLDLCNRLLSLERAAIDPSDVQFTQRVQLDQLNTQYVRQLEDSIHAMEEIIVNEWVDMANTHTVRIDTPCFEVFLAIQAMLESEGCRLLSMENISFVVGTVHAVFKLIGGANALIANALRTQRPGHDAVGIRWLCFLHEQQRFVRFLSDYLWRNTKSTEVVKTIYSKYLDLLGDANEVLSCANRKKLVRAYFHPALASLAQPIWIRLASMELESTTTISAAFRKTMGAAIGKVCEYISYWSLPKGLRGALHTQEGKIFYPFQENPWQCICRFPDSFQTLNAIFQFYLRKETKLGEVDRTQSLRKSWAEKASKLTGHNCRLVTEFDRATSRQEPDDPDKLHIRRDPRRKALVSLFMNACLNETQWAPWLNCASQDANGKLRKVDFYAEYVASFFISVNQLKETRDVLFPNKNGLARTLPALLTAILGQSLNLDDGMSIHQESDNLRCALSSLSEMHSAAIALIEEENCNLCGKGVVLEKPQASRKLKIAQGIFNEYEWNAHEQRLFQGDLLSPSTRTWLGIFTVVEEAIEESRGAVIEQVQRYSEERVKRTIYSLWSSAVINYYLRCTHRTAESEFIFISAELRDFIRHHASSSQSSQHESASDHIPPYRFMPVFFEKNIGHLVDEMHVLFQTVLYRLELLSNDFESSNVSVTAAIWSDLVETITLSTQFIALVIQLPTVESVEDVRTQTNMRNACRGMAREDLLEDKSKLFATVSDVYNDFVANEVSIAFDNNTDDKQKTEEMIAYCVHPLRMISEYLAETQLMLDGRHDHALAAYQRMLSEKSHSYVEILLNWQMTDLQRWVDHLKEYSKKTSKPAKSPDSNKLGSAKKFKLFEIAGESM